MKLLWKLLDSEVPTYQSWNFNFDFEESSSNFFPINEATYDMFLQFIDSLFFFLCDQIKLGLLERPLTEEGRTDFGDGSSQAAVYRIFFAPFQHWLYDSATGEWLSGVHEDITKYETLEQYLESSDCTDPDITLFMLHFEFALSLLYGGRDIRGV